MTMKRMIAWILILTLLLSGCGSKNADVAGSGVNMAPGAAEEPSNEIPGETAAEVTAEETTEMTTEPTEPETEPTTEPTTEPETEPTTEPTQTPTQAPTEAETPAEAEKGPSLGIDFWMWILVVAMAFCAGCITILLINSIRRK